MVRRRRGPAQLLLALVLLLALAPEGVAPPELGSLAARPVRAQSNLPSFSVGWSSTEADLTESLAWGDYDGDGDLDLAAGNNGPNRLYRNDGGVLNPTAVWSSSERDNTTSVAWGDYDGDGFLDLAAANLGGQNRVYRNNRGVLGPSAVWSSNEWDATRSVAWGDYDGDGFLDLAAGNEGQPNRVYRNDTGVLAPAPVWSSGETTADSTWSVAWGDYDRDGFLDLAAGNAGQPNRVYRNEAGALTATAVWSSGETTADTTRSVAWGDYDGDGFLDLAAGNAGQPNRVYRNEDGVLGRTAAWSSTETDNTRSVAWGDYDGDGDLDLAVGNETPGLNRVYRNDKGVLGSSATWTATQADHTISVAWGDYDGDGDLDLAAGNFGRPNRVYRNASEVLSRSASWFVTQAVTTTSVAWGDYDRDGDLDLAAGNDGQSNQVFRNDEGALNPTAVWSSNETDNTASMAWGDYDGDGDLDLAAGNKGQPNRVYRTTNGVLGSSPIWSSGEAENTASVAWGDYDGDGDLDLAAGNDGGPNQVYGNANGVLSSDPVWSSNEWDPTRSVAWGDYDGDGDLDLAAGNFGQPSRVYRNDYGVLSPAAVWSSDEAESTWSVAWGDYDRDGDLDLAVGNDGQSNRVYGNEGGVLNPVAVWSSNETDFTTSVAWGDYDGDGDLDLAAGNKGQNRVYRNEGGALSFSASWSSNDGGQITTMAWGDYDGDGDLDLAASANGRSQVYASQRALTSRLTPPLVSVRQPAAPPPQSPLTPLPGANGLATPQVLGSTVTFAYVLRSPHEAPASRVSAQFSLDGGGSWRPAVAATGTQTTTLPSSLDGVPHVYRWDTVGSGVFGQTDQAVFRLVVSTDAERDPRSGELGADAMRNALQSFRVPGPFLYAGTTTSSQAFRLRGTLARVLREDNTPAPNALVYRLPAGQTRGAAPLANWLTGSPQPSLASGYVASRAPLLASDRLAAVWPVTTTGRLTYAYVSAAPTTSGLEMAAVSAAGGTQALVARPRHPLLLLNLSVGLEWDARGDPTFVSGLQGKLRRASELLYDWSNGQVALGRLTLYHGKERWEHQLDAQGNVLSRGVDLRIYASNQVRPNATQGGITDRVISETYTLAPGGTRTLTYEPGYIRIGAGWSSAGDAGVDVPEDWARALAHEIGHYALFLDETYLGKEDGLLVPVAGCPSPMADPYIDSASEFRPTGDWPAACRQTLQYLGTGLSEWGLIKARYDRTQARHGFGFTLSAPASVAEQPGPSALPLAVTTFADATAAPPAGVTSLAYGVIPPDRGRYEPSPGARVFAFPEGGPPIDLGAPAGDQIQTRGLAPGDRLCLFDPEQDLLGCGLSATGLHLVTMSGWRPEVQLTPTTYPRASGTATMTLRVAIPADSVAGGAPATTLQLRLFPLEGSVGPVTATLRRVGGAYSGEVRLPEVVEEGLLHLWVDEPPPRREIVADYAIGGNPAPRRKPPRRSRRYAPAVSPDGQATLFAEDTTLDPGQFFALQRAASLPELPAWATAVGQGYRLVASDPALLERPDTPIALSLSYAEGEVPPGFEGEVRVLFHDGTSWRDLPTRVDRARNEAAVPAQATPGTYVLVTSLRLRFSTVGWNLLFSYPGATQALPEALEGAPAALRMVYGYSRSDQSDPWKLYSPHAPAWVSDLRGLTELDSYWINVSEPVTVPVKLPGATAQVADQGILPPPPMAVWGELGSDAGFLPRPGIRVEAVIDGKICGRSVTQATGAGVGFVIDVLAAGGGGVVGCGFEGADVTIRFLASDGAVLATRQMSWDHNDLRKLTSTEDAVSVIFVPLAKK